MTRHDDYYRQDHVVQPQGSATPKPRAGEHTKEPWIVEEGHDRTPFIGPLGNTTVAKVYDPADARRIVACVNLLEETPTDQIESDWKQGWEPYGAAKHFEAERDSLAAQNRELREALSIIAGEPRQDDTYARMDKVQIARAALAKHGR